MDRNFFALAITIVIGMLLFFCFIILEVERGGDCGCPYNRITGDRARQVHTDECRKMKLEIMKQKGVKKNAIL